jgi:hypothetical protein
MENKYHFETDRKNENLSKKLAAIVRKQYSTSVLIYLIIGLIFVTVGYLQLQ